MATLRLRDNFAKNGWESSLARGASEGARGEGGGGSMNASQEYRSRTRTTDTTRAKMRGECARANLRANIRYPKFLR